MKPRKWHTYCIFLASNVSGHEKRPSKKSILFNAKMSKSYETFGKNQCFGGPGNDPKFYHFLTLRHATLNLRHHESAIRIAFSGLPHLLPKAISLLPTYMFTVIFLQHADFEKRRKRYTYCVFVPSGLPRGTPPRRLKNAPRRPREHLAGIWGGVFRAKVR